MSDTFSTQSHSVIVTVKVQFIEEESLPNGPHYVWAYHINIQNQSVETLQLLRRFWRIVDATGYVEEVEGEGVVGEMPILAPGESYQYTSGVPLNTPSGIMGGYYEMETQDERTIKILIPTFVLNSPEESVTIN